MHSPLSGCIGLEVTSNDLMPLAYKDDIYFNCIRKSGVECGVIHASVSQQVRGCPYVYAALQSGSRES
jgi:hypothetical protein